MVSLEQMRKRLWDEMDQSQRAEYMDEYRAQVAAGKAADVVYRARHEAGLTQEELARRLGKKQTYVSALERGRGNPTVATLEKVIAATGNQLTLGVGTNTDEAA